MLAVMVTHDTRAGLLASPDHRAGLDAAGRAWMDFLSGQPGFLEFITLGNAHANRVIAVSLWESEEDFRAVMAHPRQAAGRAGFAGMFEKLTPEFFEVLDYRRP